MKLMKMKKNQISNLYFPNRIRWLGKELVAISKKYLVNNIKFINNLDKPTLTSKKKEHSLEKKRNP